MLESTLIEKGGKMKLAELLSLIVYPFTLNCMFTFFSVKPMMT